ncbi:hypothetical protein ACQFN5_00245 (plasmid) [Klebsiella sp. WOUb02]|uniref:hypothetical protein n=1 Tax=Klebsiella sp. WOUb02 TaxID=3161071 RepID=UPI003CFADC26
MAEQIQALRRDEILFLGRNAQGALPLKTVTEGVTRRAAIKAFVAQYRPTGGWFLGDPQDITDRRIKEAGADSEPQK